MTQLTCRAAFAASTTLVPWGPNPRITPATWRTEPTWRIVHSPDCVAPIVPVTETVFVTFESSEEPVTLTAAPARFVR